MLRSSCLARMAGVRVRRSVAQCQSSGVLMMTSASAQAAARAKSDDELPMSSARAAAEALRKEQEEEAAMVAEKRAAREAEKANKKAEAELSPEEQAARKEAYEQRRKDDMRHSRRELGAHKTAGLSAIKAVVGRGALLLPFAVVFAFCSMAYVIYESTQRHANPVCVDCNRQKEIAEEIYFGKKTRLTARQMP